MNDCREDTVEDEKYLDSFTGRMIEQMIEMGRKTIFEVKC